MSFILKILSMFLLLLLGCSSQEKNIYIESPDKNISVKVLKRNNDFITMSILTGKQ